MPVGVSELREYARHIKTAVAGTATYGRIEMTA